MPPWWWEWSTGAVGGAGGAAGAGGVGAGFFVGLVGFVGAFVGFAGGGGAGEGEGEGETEGGRTGARIGTGSVRTSPATPGASSADAAVGWVACAVCAAGWCAGSGTALGAHDTVPIDRTRNSENVLITRPAPAPRKCGTRCLPPQVNAFAAFAGLGV